MGFDEESDTWFLIRRHWTRLSVCACGCGADSKLFPCGFFAGAPSQAHLNLEIEWMRHVPIGAAALGVHTSSLPSLPVMLPSPPALRHDGRLDSATALLRQSAPWLQRACVLCGYGDNSSTLDVFLRVSRCSRFAAARLLLALFSLVSASAPRTQSARCYALYAGARAIIRQRGGLAAKHGDPPAAVPLDLLHIACLVATCAFELLPCDVRMGVRPAWLVGSSALRSCVWLDHVRFAAGAPLHALSPKIPHFTYFGDSSALPGSLLAVVMEHGRERHLLQAYHHGTPNITLEARVCECGVAHIYVLAVQVVRPGDPLICASRAWKWAALVAHFDGSCHRADAAWRRWGHCAKICWG